MMTFEELIAAKDAAVAEQDYAAKAKAEAESLLAEAIGHFDGAIQRLAAAHQAIVDRLTEKGHHSLYDAAGSLCVYQTNAESPVGWSYYQPIPGEKA